MEGEVDAAFTSEAAEVGARNRDLIGAPEPRSTKKALASVELAIRLKKHRAPTFGGEQQKADGTAALKRVAEIVWRC
jgi:hypothetical protein